MQSKQHITRANQPRTKGPKTAIEIKVLFKLIFFFIYTFTEPKLSTRNSFSTLSFKNAFLKLKYFCPFFSRSVSMAGLQYNFFPTDLLYPHTAQGSNKKPIHLAPVQTSGDDQQKMSNNSNDSVRLKTNDVVLRHKIAKITKPLIWKNQPSSSSSSNYWVYDQLKGVFFIGKENKFELLTRLWVVFNYFYLKQLLYILKCMTIHFGHVGLLLCLIILVIIN